MRPALLFVLILTLTACGAAAPSSAPAPSGAPVTSAVVAEEELSLEISALM